MGRGQVVPLVAASLAALVFLALSSDIGAEPRVVINEVLYDPDGSDTGYEFAELFNCALEPVCLQGWMFETGNGAYENRWKHEWTGLGTDTVEARGFFVIGEDLVLPPPDFVTALDLQNGPDGCRLVAPDGSADVVGWGDLVYEEYYEGSPATCAHSGVSIGRDPDGSDRDLNSEDFRLLEVPSPGDFNHPPFDLAIEKAGLSRYTSTSGADIDIACMLVNSGIEVCGDATVSAALGALLDSIHVPDALEPSEQVKVVVRLPHPGEGLHTIRVWHRQALDRWHWNDSVSTSIVLPPPPVVINEVMFKPTGTECEWIEIFAHGTSGISIRDWTLEDHRGTKRKLVGDDLMLSRGDMLVLVEDVEVFAVAHPDLDRGCFLRPSGGWPTLNDVDGPLDFADMIIVRDARGTMVDSVAYRTRWSRPGISFERIDPRGPSSSSSNWSPHYGNTSGSPGRANSVSFHLPGDGSILTLSPSAFSPDGDGQDDLLAIAARLCEPCLVRLSIFDLSGRLVKRLIDGEVVETSRTTFWDGRDDNESRQAMGAYLVLLEAKATASDRTYRARSPAVLVRR
ncbi:MAG: lamin tail domain-containing protein [Candidatus Eisenbacteria bacterium]